MNATQKYRRRRGWRPLLEILEDRLVPASYTVNSTGDTGTGTGLTGDLRYCITQADANPGSLIGFDATVFATPQTITLNGTALPDVSQSVQINGPAAGITVNAAGKSRVFVIDAGATVMISGLTITGGFNENDQNFNPAGNGGGIANSGTLTLTNCTLTGNTVAAIGANGGGAIANFASLTMSGCTVSGNNALTSGQGEGGGITNSGTMSLTDCTVSGNSSGLGGGFTNDGTATLTDCTVANNSNSGLINTGALTMTGCTVRGNFIEGGGTGGGMENFGNGTATLINCTVSGNTAGGTGGGFINENGARLILTNCTVSGNTADAVDSGSPGGGGIANFGEGTATLNNTIVAGNQALDSPDVLNVTSPGAIGIVTAAFSLIGDGTGSGLANGVNGNRVGTAASPINPLLAPLGNYGGPTQTMALLPGSPAIAAGSVALAVDQNGQPLATDQRGLPRVVHGAVDIGAFEFQGDIVVNSTADNNVRDNVLTLREALLFVDGTLTLGDLTAAEQQQVGSDAGEPGAFVITFDPTVFATAQTITLDGTALPDVSKSVAIDGPAAGVTVNAAGQSRVFVIDSGTTVNLSNLIITGGSVSGQGGGILCSGALTLSNCTLNGNTASGNDGSGRGGGIFNGVGALTLTDCVLSGNSAADGGGLVNGSGPLTLRDCTLSGNSAFIDGGGLFVSGPTTLTGCTLNGNVAVAGGGIDNGGPLTLINCTLFGNTAQGNSVQGGGQGGGIRAEGPLTLTNCTVSGNSASVGAGGLFVPSLTLNNSIVAGNAAPASPDIDGTVMAQYSLIQNAAGANFTADSNHNLTGLDPRLAPLGNYGGPTQTFALLPGSPAIDAGTASGAPTTDQRGLPRVGAVDIGAFESQGFTFTVLAGANQSTTVGTAFPTALAVKVTANNAAEPVQGGVVTFTAPASGASATFAGGQASATIDATGTATAPPLTANDIAGSYAVTATTAGAATSAFFPLTNTPGTTPPTLPPAPPGLDANQRFVYHLYQNLLGRTGSPAEVNFFGSVLDQGFLTQEQLATFFLNSFEYHEHQVDQLYLRLLGRHVDAATEAAAALFLSGGGSLDQIEAIILGSDEYFQLHGGTNAGFLQGLGQDVTGGTLDPGVMGLLEAELVAGTPRYVVALQVLGTPQAAVAEAEQFYQQILQRSASASELLVPAVYILEGNETAVLLALLLSNEFASLP